MRFVGCGSSMLFCKYRICDFRDLLTACLHELRFFGIVAQTLSSKVLHLRRHAIELIVSIGKMLLAGGKIEASTLLE